MTPTAAVTALAARVSVPLAYIELVSERATCATHGIEDAQASSGDQHRFNRRLRGGGDSRDCSPRLRCTCFNGTAKGDAPRCTQSWTRLMLSSHRIV